MFEKILFPTDFSEPSKNVLKAIEELDNECGSKSVIVVHVVDEHDVNSAANLEGFYSISIDHIREEIQKEFNRQAKAFMKAVTEELFQKGYDRDKIKTMVLFGNPAEEIVKLAKMENVNCIVMGSRGRGQVAEFILGSTSDKVIRKAKCPVLVIK